jgi:hypothetical protein
MNRYYSTGYGRFLTADPYMSNSGGSGNPRDPQSWNRYAYTRGDPVNRFDPAGMQDCGTSEVEPISCSGVPILFPGGGGSSQGGQSWKGTHILPPATEAALFRIEVLALKGDAKDFADDLLTGNIPAPCAADLGKLGITPDQWAAALNNVSILNGLGSTVPLASTLPYGSDAWQTAQNLNLTVGGQFVVTSSSASITVAWSSVNAGLVWINPYYVNPGNFLAASALIAHETLHNLGLLDPTIQTDLGLAVSSSNTDNIPVALQADCFPGQGGPSLLP